MDLFASFFFSSLFHGQGCCLLLVFLAALCEPFYPGVSWQFIRAGALATSCAWLDVSSELINIVDIIGESLLYTRQVLHLFLASSSLECTHRLTA